MAKLSLEDQQRVDDYLQASLHQVPRRDFKPGLLLIVLIGVLLLLTGVSYLVAFDAGVV
ncbi:DUF3094 family protein [Teredinibacter turnerae]|uniref:Hypothetic protein n=1 Tax=Teredinibacter turnerae (strain ATCC 39867 / T7901) TaxID=377629 RepID=C5BN05_TERTT|nr:DUF3094 family protein [Teredinibacter turnerae]ACR11367.1 Hypothetic protein [Teredinibacter turnerae T7901]